MNNKFHISRYLLQHDYYCATTVLFSFYSKPSDSLYLLCTLLRALLLLIAIKICPLYCNLTPNFSCTLFDFKSCEKVGSDSEGDQRCGKENECEKGACEKGE